MRLAATTNQTFPTTYDYAVDGPGDSREAVDTKADLINKGTWLVEGCTYLWSGMRVSVKDEGALYMLVGDSRDYGFFYKEELGYISSQDKDGTWTAIQSDKVTRYSATTRSGWKRIDISDIYVNNLGAESVTLGDSKQLFKGSIIDPAYLPGYVDDTVTITYTQNEDGSVTVAAINEDETDLLAKEDIVYYVPSTGDSYRYSGGTYILISSSGSAVYTPADDITDATIANTIGGLKNKTKSSLASLPISEILDMMLFPENPAYKGSVISYGVSNPNATIEVGGTVPSASRTSSGSTSNCGYIQSVSNGKYIYGEGQYQVGIPTISDTVEVETLSDTTPAYTSIDRDSITTAWNKQFRVTSASTTYKITSPSTGLSDGKLFNSRGSVSSLSPISGGDQTINSTVAIIGTAYQCMVNGAKGTLWQKYDGSLATSVNGTYADSQSIKLRNDASTSADTALGSVYTFALPKKASSVSIAILIWNPTAEAFKPYASANNEISASQSTYLTVSNTASQSAETTNGDDYSLYLYTLDLTKLPSDKTASSKFIITVTINK